MPVSHAAVPNGVSLPAGDLFHLQGEAIRRQVTEIAELLPAQGPITAFVFLNTLQGLEELPYDEAVALGARLFDCEPYLTEDKYHEFLQRGRIRETDLAEVVRDELAERADEPLQPVGTLYDLRLGMVRHRVRLGPPQELAWFIAETDALTRFRDDVQPHAKEQFVRRSREWVLQTLAEPRIPGVPGARGLLPVALHSADLTAAQGWSERAWEKLSLETLWRICIQGVGQVQDAPHRNDPPVRPRDLLRKLAGHDADLLVHDVLVRLCAAFVDQGQAGWSLPRKEAGFYQAFIELYRDPGQIERPWMEGVAAELQLLSRGGISPLDSVQASLADLGITPERQREFLTATLLALRGWAGLIWQLESRGDRVAHPAPAGSLVEFLAVRLILDRYAARSMARRDLNYTGPLGRLADLLPSENGIAHAQQVETRALLVFQVAQVCGWSVGDLAGLAPEHWRKLIQEIEDYGELARRRTLHRAYELNFRIRALDAIALHAVRPARRIENPRFQAVFCIDTREESFRRHLEEVCPEAETFSTAGFFGVPIYYKGVADAHFATLCPIVVRPQHWVVEDVVYTQEEVNRRRQRTRRAFGSASKRMTEGTRGVASGAVLTAGLGVLASIPLVAGVLFPRLTSKIQSTASRFMEPPQMTRLRLERTAEKPGPEGGGIGFTVDEMTFFAEKTLRDIGLTRGFARLVFFFGHGSFCLNNPHKSAYDCGACSGGAGSPNARALAAMLNDVRVRQNLLAKGIEIPHTTTFIGGLHNTCADSLTYHELEMLPVWQQETFEFARARLEETCERNAHERCRRFNSAPLNLTRPAALRHVENRAVDLAQTRPEFGNASNAMCVVGRRSRTRGLYLDRRAFLMSYDPTQDDAEYTILARTLGAVVFVCAGINLQYNFSYIDSPGWGSGTKLPHNVTSLLGVMDGASSDLRTGLPWQGVEIHEPLRCLFVIEAPPEALYKIMERNPVVRRLIVNGWVQLSLLSPDSNEIQLYRNGQFEPYHPRTPALPATPSSYDWYHGSRDPLPFAVLEPDIAPAQPTEGVQA